MSIKLFRIMEHITLLSDLTWNIVIKQNIDIERHTRVQIFAINVFRSLQSYDHGRIVKWT